MPTRGPRTGRRRIRAGSVRVSELIGRRARAGSADADSATPANPDTASDASARTPAQPSRAHLRRARGRAHLVKLVGLGVASLLLCGSFAFAALFAHERRQESTAEDAPAQLDLDGEQALLPDLLNQAVPPSGVTAPARPRPRPAAKTGTPGRPVPGGSAAPVPSAVIGPGTPPVTEPASPELSKTELVEHFYRLVPAWPDRAFALLDGALPGIDLGEFERSWSQVSDIEVEAHEEGDDVLAVVRLRLPDGSCLRVQQLVSVTDSVPHRILGAHVLSAQRN